MVSLVLGQFQDFLWPFKLGRSFSFIFLLYIILLLGSFSREWWHVINSFLFMQAFIWYGIFEFAKMVSIINNYFIIIMHTYFALILSISILGCSKKRIVSCINIGGEIGLKEWNVWMGPEWDYSGLCNNCLLSGIIAWKVYPYGFRRILKKIFFDWKQSPLLNYLGESFLIDFQFFYPNFASCTNLQWQTS